MTAPVAPALAIEHLFFSANKELILEDISLCMNNGDFLALIGPNGGGKTTLFRLILGLLEPESGSVRTFGQAPQQMRHLIGYVPQFSTLQTNFPSSVLDMVLMGGAKNSWRGARWSHGTHERQKALTLLSLLGLEEKSTSPLDALSGGQRQRALIARALMGKPEGDDVPFLLLLDEPTASIDLEGKNCFYGFLDTLRGKITIIVVSHDLMLASPFFSQVVFINKTMTIVPDNKLTPESLAAMFGDHHHSCPLGGFQHTALPCTDVDCTFDPDHFTPTQPGTRQPDSRPPGAKLPETKLPDTKRTTIEPSGPVSSLPSETPGSPLRHSSS